MDLLLFPLMTIAGVLLGHYIPCRWSLEILLNITVLSFAVLYAIDKNIMGHKTGRVVPVKIFGFCMVVWNFTLSMSATNMLTWLFS